MNVIETVLRNGELRVLGRNEAVRLMLEKAKRDCPDRVEPVRSANPVLNLGDFIYGADMLPTTEME